jgi:hypothetical protein
MKQLMNENIVNLVSSPRKINRIILKIKEKS